MKLSVQDGMLPGRGLSEKLDNAAKYGYDAIEIGGAILLTNFDSVARAFEGHPVRLSSICSGFGGCLLDASRAERDRAVSDIQRLIEAGGRLGAVGLIAVPCFGGPRIADLSPWKDARSLEIEMLVELLAPIADTGAKNNCVLLVEPLNRYETHLLNTLADAAAVVKRVRKKGIAIMADFFHMSIEEDDIAKAIAAEGKLIRHIHLADSQRLQPGTGHTDFKPAFKALKKAGFKDYLALECSVRGPRASALTACAKFLREQMK